ncbi:50S ribosomal protein L3 [Virgibacillus pantothenticus]|uniref:Large ribosomal subunit protein uL3 n=1 Tax=Virgibacillus pantothenticus TaxID=1473 RepID=A0A0L0QWT9_VIRPA|nr:MULTISPECIES: 50S ribosomal protein L3 [Virgibacillus]API92370.1 50S ribosomal protein L3 [Virgibacillus sp. 6R]KNE22683.1 50S ribosomal protein L3 [Virgibacillus pantothenticus]MBS7427390.1 50S ribosomal protein L3 [Virgibacillus sp. 19R1-5]MBU8566956.1 50S ribosomal protein L3 [Virgibacillus pantothenticus]MBU8602532.1 50S ribosomal protein L3 [Virgibacillus pantothenticus]
MTKGILGRKIGMTQLFSETGELMPVTVIEAEPNVVLQKRTLENDGYEAIQLGVVDVKESRTNKAEKGHAEKANTTPKRYVREIRNAKLDEYEVGQEVSVNVFAAGDKIDVTGTTKGKGFQGSIKRHNQQRGPETHGSHYHRGPGSLGAVDPMRVFKGRPLPGRMGGEQVTIQNLEVVKVDEERNLLLVKGNVPGAKKSFVKITSAIKAN